MPGPHDSAAPAGLATLGVVGVGLIGGSVALAARKRWPDCRVVGLGRSRDRLAPAVDAGVLNEATDRPEDLAGCTLVVACTPVDRIAADLAAVAPHLREDAVLTDAGSTKATVCEAASKLPRPGRFVGGHPMAGSEKTGWRNATADLFEGRTAAVTPTERCHPDATGRVAQFWSSLGSRVLLCDPEVHDRLVAAVSHMPHLAASAVVRAAGDDLSLAASGFADATRLAAGDPDLWTAIVRENAGPVAESLAALESEIRSAREAVERSDWPAVRDFLAAAADRRRRLDPGAAP